MPSTEPSRVLLALLFVVVIGCSREPAPTPPASVDPPVGEPAPPDGGTKIGRHTVEEWELELTHQDPRIRRAAVRELEVLGPDARPLGPALLARVSDPSETFEIRTAVLRVVPATCGEEAIAVLQPLFTDGGAYAQNAAAALIEIGPASEPVLRAGLSSGNAEVRRVAATGLFRLFEHGLEFETMSAAAVELVPTLADEDGSVRRAAFRCLVFLGERAGAAVPALVAQLDGDADAQTREAVLAVLGAVGEPAKTALPAIERELRSESPAVRLEAATTVASLGKVDDGLTVMTAMLREDDPVWRREAAIQIGKLGPAAASARGALEEALAGEPDSLAIEAMEEALRFLGS